MFWLFCTSFGVQRKLFSLYLLWTLKQEEALAVPLFGERLSGSIHSEQGFFRWRATVHSDIPRTSCLNLVPLGLARRKCACCVNQLSSYSGVNIVEVLQKRDKTGLQLPIKSASFFQPRERQPLLLASDNFIHPSHWQSQAAQLNNFTESFQGLGEVL